MYAALLVTPACVLPPSAPDDSRSRLEQRWRLGDPERARTLAPLAHEPTYVLPVRWSSDPNQELEDATATELGTEPQQLDAFEVEFQLSFKARVLDDLPLGSSLWAAYTQLSHWQAYADSSPFRATDHAPEVMWNVPLERELFGWKLRFVDLAYLHQSNGQSEPLSRSWDRLYARFGIERGRVALLVRPWLVVGDDSDNPDIEQFLGHGDVTAVWTNGQHVVSLVLRNNLEFDDNKGSLSADWSFGPLDGPRFYVRAFTGYGDSLIDYDHAQTAIGVGVILVDRL